MFRFGLASCEIGIYSAHSKVLAAAGNFRFASFAASAQSGVSRNARLRL
jgi:hypothetical protein